MMMEIAVNLPAFNDYPYTHRIREFLTNKGYTFEENIKVNIQELFNDASIRPIDEKHVELLCNRMKNDRIEIENLLYQTPIIALSHQPAGLNTFLYKKYSVIDGNHRLQAIQQYNASQVRDFIDTLTVSFKIFSNDIPLEHKLALTSMAESKIYQNKKFLNKYEIMNHTRYLLIKCPEILDLEPLPENSTTIQQKYYGKKVVEAVTNFFHVGHPSLVLSNIWKVTRISDADFNKMYKRFPDLPSGFDVNDFDVVFNKYVLSPGQITKLMTMETFPPLNDFRKLLRKDVKKDFVPLLKHHKALNPLWDVKQHLIFIGGEEYVTENGVGKSEEVIEKYLCEKKRNLRRFKDADKKLKYLKRNFSEWLKEESNIDKSPEPVDEQNGSTTNYSNNQEDIIKEKHFKATMDFVEMLIHNNRASLAAFVVHYLLRPFCSENQLPVFYSSCIQGNEFPLTLIRRDDGNFDDIPLDMEHFGACDYFNLTLPSVEKTSRKRRLGNNEISNIEIQEKRTNIGDL